MEIPPCTNLYDSINGHVDIQINILDKNKRNNNTRKCLRLLKDSY